MQTPNKINENVERIATLFPNCVTESIDKDGKPTKVVDFDLLKQELSDFAVEGQEERYQFTWADKKKSILLANSPISKTLRPCREESVNFDTTKNLYIEGDNLDVLKLLQETYLGKVKMIYIDPPYNTGNDFVYEDDFAISAEEYFERSGASDDEGNRLFQNNDSNGRFHTDWLNMIYPRLKLARDLLTDDGVIFISIDDNEIHNLRKICDEVFGADNFVGCLIWRGGKRNAAKVISTSHEYMMTYAKNLCFCLGKNIYWRERKKGIEDIYSKAGELNKLTKNNYEKSSDLLKEWFKSLKDDNPAKDHEHYCNIDARGVYFASDISRGGGGGPTWEITNPKTGNIVKTPSRGWAYSSKENLLEDIRQDLVHFNGDGVPCSKNYLKENEETLIESVFYKDRRGSSKRLKNLMSDAVFDFSKDELILKEKIESFTKAKDIILDFFAGSSTTAHSVFLQNAEDGGERKFIMVQLPENLDEMIQKVNLTAKKTIQNAINLCDSLNASHLLTEIGKERIRRAGKKIADENKQTAPNLDIGFRVLKIDSSNMKPVFYNPQAISQTLLSNTESNIKEDRTPEDLLFQVMLDMGVDLASPITVEQIGNKKVFVVGENNLICCFDKDVTKEAVTEIAKRKPLYAVFRDNGFERDDVMISFDQIFETYSPTTERRVV